MSWGMGHGACPRVRALVGVRVARVSVCAVSCGSVRGAAFPLVFDSGVLMYTHCRTHAQAACHKPLATSTSMQLYVQTQEWGYFATLACPGAGSSTRGRDRLLRDELFNRSRFV
eukprot:scaffold19481_cov112-Isochrysis_galbana.AAC.8